MTNRDECIDETKLQLDELSQNMKVLESKAREATEHARSSYDLPFDKMQDLSESAMAELDETKAASADKANAMMAEMKKIRDALAHSFHYFKSQV